PHRTHPRSCPGPSTRRLGVRRGSGGTGAYPATLIVMSFTGTDSCGNSPKNLFVARFEQNLFNGDRSALAEVVADDCVLQIVSADGAITNSAAALVLYALVSLSAQTRAFCHLEAGSPHGKAAAAWGHWQQSEDGEDPRHFSHTMWFTTHKAQAFGQIRIFQT